jgi:hypothetical protein
LRFAITSPPSGCEEDFHLPSCRTCTAYKNHPPVYRRVSNNRTLRSWGARYNAGKARSGNNVIKNFEAPRDSKFLNPSTSLTPALEP